MMNNLAPSFASITTITLFLLLSLSDVQGGTPGVAGGESGNPATDPPWRKELQDLGFTPSLEWDADVFANTRGGIKQGAVADGLIRLALDIDGQKLTGWPSLTTPIYTSKAFTLTELTFRPTLENSLP